MGLSSIERIIAHIGFYVKYIVAKIGSETIDPEEINGLTAIYKLIVKYLQDKDEKPLSIAVFGPPGTGKSTAVENF